MFRFSYSNVTADTTNSWRFSWENAWHNKVIDSLVFFVQIPHFGNFSFSKQEDNYPINAIGPYKDRFLPLRERSELPQLLLYFSSVFSLWKTISVAIFLWKIFLTDYVHYSITADAIRTILGVHWAFMVSAVTLQGT
jgi:hypothetical protein